MQVGIESSVNNVNQLLSDMKKLRGQILENESIPDAAIGVQGSKNQVPEFSEILKSAINKVNDVQKASGNLKTAYELGDPNVDITQVMVASEKSSIAFEAMKQVRNKLVDAYKEIMNMPI